MKSVKKRIITLLYLLFVAALYLVSSTITKYTTGHEGSGSFNIGQKLYFNYERGELYRNNNLIIGNPVEEEKYDEEGNIVDIVKRIETMNVTPGDNLTFHFYVSNFNLETNEVNGLDGIFYVSSYAEFTMPAIQSSAILKCTLAYREIPIEEGVEPGPFRTFTSDNKISLPVYNKDDPTSIIKYEFKVYVILDDQISTTSADDYIDATLSISLFIDASENYLEV